MNWIKVRTLKAEGLYEEPATEGDWIHPWDAAEAYMRRGNLPPYRLCQLLHTEQLQSFTRRRQWVLAGAIETLKRMEGDTSTLRKSLKVLKRQYQGKEVKNAETSITT